MRRAPSVDHSTVATPGAVVEAAPDDETTTALPEVACEHAPVGGGQRGASRTRGRGALLVGAIGSIAVLFLLASAVAPAPAQALKIPDPIDIVTGPVTGGIADMAVSAFDAIIRHLFAPITKLVTVELIGWLVAIPDFTDGTHVAQLQITVTAMAGGLLAAVATLSIARYWLIGHAGDGFAALEGLARTVAAAFALAMWPWAFGQAVHLTNLFTSSLLASDSVVKPSATMLAGALGAAIKFGPTNPLGLFLGLVIAVASLLLFLGLLLLKIAVSVSTILVFVGMPLAIVLWPVAPWVLTLVARAFVACLAVPVLWALCFASAAAVTLDSVTLSGGGAAVNKVIQPLVAIVLLYLMVKLPITLARIAMIGSQAISGGFVSRAVSYAAGRALSSAVSQQIPENAGGSRRQESGGEGSRQEPQTASRMRIAAKLAGATAAAAATGGTSAAATGTTGAAGSGASAAGRSAASTTGASGGTTNPRAYTPPASAQAADVDHLHGLQTPSFRQEDFANEKFEADLRARTAPVTTEQARDALQALPENTRSGVRQLAAEHGSHGREHLAYQATGEWTPEERDAVRTLAAATPDIRAQALSQGDDDAGTLATSGLGDQPSVGSGGLDERSIFDEDHRTEGHDQPQAPPPSPAIHTSPADGETGGGNAGGARLPTGQPSGGPESPPVAPDAQGGRVAPPPAPPRGEPPRGPGGDER